MSCPTTGFTRRPSAAGDPGRWADRRELQLVKKPVVPRVCANPEPGDLVVFQKADGAVSDGHSSGIDGVTIMNLLEVEAWVPGVFPEQPIRFLGEALDLSWQFAIRRPEARRCERVHSLSGSSSVALPAARSARASAASLLNALCEAANCRVQCSSARSSSSSHWATRSCSSAGSAASFAIAVSNARVIGRSIPTRVAASPTSDSNRPPLAYARGGG